MDMEFTARLIEEAKAWITRAYAPYSGLRVGAALLDQEGRIFCGCNVENASYGLSVCAERVAVFNAISQGSTRFRALCVAVEGDFKPTPCGACRQVLAEFSDDLEVICVNTAGYVHHTSLVRLLPDAFRLR